MSKIAWSEFQNIAKSYIGGVVCADDGSRFDHVAVIEQIIFDDQMIRVIPKKGTIRGILSDDESIPESGNRFDEGWGANMGYSGDPYECLGSINFWIPYLGSAWLYPPNHPDIKPHWISK